MDYICLIMIYNIFYFKHLFVNQKNYPGTSMSKPMLDKCIGKHMVSIYNVDDGIKNLSYQYQTCNTIQLLILGKYHKVWESLYTRIIIWVKTHIELYWWLGWFYLGMKVLDWYVDPKWYIYRSGINKGDTCPTLVFLRARIFIKSYTLKLVMHLVYCSI